MKGLVDETSTINNTSGQARSTIEKAAIAGKIVKLDTITRDGVTDYKAVIKKDGNNTEIKVSAGGLIIK